MKLQNLKSLVVRRVNTYQIGGMNVEEVENVTEVNVIEVTVNTVKNMIIMVADLETVKVRVKVVTDQDETGQDRGRRLLNVEGGVLGHVIGDLRKGGDPPKEEVRPTAEGPQNAEDPLIDADHPTAETGPPNVETVRLNAGALQNAESADARQITDVHPTAANVPLIAETSKTSVPTKNTVPSFTHPTNGAGPGATTKSSRHQAPDTVTSRETQTPL